MYFVAFDRDFVESTGQSIVSVPLSRGGGECLFFLLFHNVFIINLAYQFTKERGLTKSGSQVIKVGMMNDEE